MKRLVWIAALLALCAAGFWWFQHRQTTNAGTVGGGQPGSSRGGGPGGGGGRGGPGGPVPVVAGTAEQKEVPIYLDGLGTVQAFNSINVRPRVDGELTEVRFTEGQEVKRGDLLAVIDPRPFQAAVDMAEAKKKQDEAQLANAKLVLSRNEDLLRKHVLDQQTFDAARFQADVLAATVQGDQAALDSAKTQLSYTRLVSPIDGRAGVRQVDQGNVVRASDANGVVVIAQLHPVSVSFTLPENNLRDILRQSADGRKLPVVAFNRANTDALGRGELAVVDNQIDQTTGTVRMKATFPNDDLALWPGQFVNARLLLTTRRGVVVPASVVQRGPNGTYAFVIKPDNTAEMRPVKVAQTEAGETLLDEGLEAGQRVVVDGQYRLQPGSKVEIQGPAGKDPGRQAGRPPEGGQKRDRERSRPPG